MPYTYTLTTVIPATPEEIYEAWLDTVAHSEMTGGEANVSGEVGADFSAWNEYITGRNIELVPGERIVQSWRTSEFSDDHADSVVTLTLEPVEEGTLLTLVHSNVPDEHRSYEEGGWESQYFEPMRAYFAKFDQAEAAEEPETPEPAAPEPPAAPQPPAEPRARPAAPPRTKKARAPQAAPKAKAAGAKKKKTKRAAPAKSKRQTARAGAKKSKKAAPKRAAKKKAAAKRTAAKRKSGARKRARR